jgi:hypothetical protein
MKEGPEAESGIPVGRISCQLPTAIFWPKSRPAKSLELPSPFISASVTGDQKLFGFRSVKSVYSMWTDSSRLTRHFHEKAGPCQAVFLVLPTMRPTADQREARLAFSLSFIESFLFSRRDS